VTQTTFWGGGGELVANRNHNEVIRGCTGDLKEKNNWPWDCFGVGGGLG